MGRLRERGKRKSRERKESPSSHYVSDYTEDSELGLDRQTESPWRDSKERKHPDPTQHPKGLPGFFYSQEGLLPVHCSHRFKARSG